MKNESYLHFGAQSMSNRTCFGPFGAPRLELHGFVEKAASRLLISPTNAPTAQDHGEGTPFHTTPIPE